MAPRPTFWSHAVGMVIVLATALAGHESTLRAQAAATGVSDDQAVRAMETQRGEALLKADTTALSTMIADDFVEISRFGQLRSKADNMRDLASGDLKLLTVKYDDTTVRVYGDIAVLTAIADNTGTFRGIPFAGKIRYTRVFVRRNGGWQAVLMQQTVMP